MGMFEAFVSVLNRFGQELFVRTSNRFDAQ